jgi:pesticin/yersiniabactin receptor
VKIEMKNLFFLTASIVIISTNSASLAQSVSETSTNHPGTDAEKNSDGAGSVLYLAPVTVNALKRKQSSFDVIGNVSVQTSEQLEAASATKTEDLGSVFPELSNMNRSARIYNNMTIRGQSSADYFSPSVGLY